MELHTENRSPERVFAMEIRYLKPEEFSVETGLGQSFRFLFFEKGSGSVSIDGKSFSVISPACLLLDEREVLEVSPDKGFRVHGLFFSPSIINSSFDFENVRDASTITEQSQILDLYFLRGFLERGEKYSGVLLTGPGTALKILELLRNINDELTLQRDGFWPCRSRSFFLELMNLLGSLVQNPLAGGSLPESDELVKSVMEYINCHYHEKITIGEITGFFGTNRTTLSERFMKSAGMSVISYLSKIRINMACLLLRDTALPVAEIVYRTGYEDAAHFGRVFKKETGLSPSSYREKNSAL